MDIKELLDNKVSYIDIDNSYIIPKEYYTDTSIIDLSKVKVLGKLTYPSDDNLLLEIECTGSMTLEDSVTLEEVNYPLNIDINK